MRVVSRQQLTMKSLRDLSLISLERERINPFELLDVEVLPPETTFVRPWMSFLFYSDKSVPVPDYPPWEGYDPTTIQSERWCRVSYDSATYICDVYSPVPMDYDDDERTRVPERRIYETSEEELTDLLLSFYTPTTDGHDMEITHFIGHGKCPNDLDFNLSYRDNYKIIVKETSTNKKLLARCRILDALNYIRDSC